MWNRGWIGIVRVVVVGDGLYIEDVEKKKEESVSSGYAGVVLVGVRGSVSRWMFSFCSVTLVMFINGLCRRVVV